MNKRTALVIMLMAPLIASAQMPDAQLRVHHDSNIQFSVTNFGFFGSQGGSFIDPETGQPAPGAEFPSGSGKDYLFMGSLWIGAEIDTVDAQGNPIRDTLVSVGNDGWWGQVFELLPPPEGYQSMWEDSANGDEEFYAIYFDTLTDVRYVSQDPIDQRPHIPLGLKVTQHSIGWTAPVRNEFFLISFNFENIGSRSLHNVWLGMYYDGDVMHESENPYAPEQGAQDDLCGFLPYGENGIAWIADNDGQPYGGQFNDLSPTGVMGWMLLGSSETNVQTTFNWWMPSLDSVFDWGPQLQSNFDRWGPFPGGGRGNPQGDKAKYQVMSNGEQDYDQALTALDHTAEGWIAGPPQAVNIANGYDTRFLISFGPFQLSPGESSVVTVAYPGGNNLHTDPLNYADRLRDHETDSASIRTYYEHLGFSDLRIKADSARNLYESGIDEYSPQIPLRTTLLQNYPNPFNGSTVIRYYLNEKSTVKLTVYNLLGQQVATLLEGLRDAGEHAVTWDARDLPSGVYFARLESGQRLENIRMVLLK